MRQFAEHVLHVDMDAFFVEVERLRDPRLRNRPVIVGGLGARGVVAAASYEARRTGVGSAMPMVEARRRCPAAVYLPPDHAEYARVSKDVFDVLHGFTPLVEGISVDEAFLDISGLRLHHPDAAAVGRAVRAEIRRCVGIPASVGVATSKFVAKLASEEAKPDGLVVVARGGEIEFLAPLPVARMWGVGQATLAVLEGLGITTIGELAGVPEDVLARRVGRSLGRHLHDLAGAIDERPVEPHGVAKSVSVEETFAADIGDEELLARHLLRLCNRLAGRLRRAGVAGRTVHLKVRFSDFTTVGRSVTVDATVRLAPEIWDVARDLLARVDSSGREIRLLGVGVSSLEPDNGPRQLQMTQPGRDAVAEAAERVRDRFGDDAVVPARLVEPPGKRGR